MKPNIRQRLEQLADSLEEKIIGLYGLGMGLRDISAHIGEMYGTRISPSTLSEITDRIIPKVREWQQRPISAVYAIIWMDARGGRYAYRLTRGGPVNISGYSIPKLRRWLSGQLVAIPAQNAIRSELPSNLRDFFSALHTLVLLVVAL